MKDGRSEVIEYFIKNLKIDTTKFNKVCNILSHYFVYSKKCNSGWGYRAANWRGC